MTTGISIQKLIDQVKKELLEPTSSPDYPLFFVDKVELELAVAITEAASGEIGISVLDLISAKSAEDISSQYGHKITISLVPILTEEERRNVIKIGEKQKERIAKVYVKSDDEEMAGSPE